MWTEYKREIMLREEDNEAFLRTFYRQSMREHQAEHGPIITEDQLANGEVIEEELEGEERETVEEQQEYSLDVVFDSDEEGYVPPPSKEGTKDEKEEITKKNKKPKRKLFGKKKSKRSESPPVDECMENAVNEEQEDHPLAEDEEDEEEMEPSALEMFAADKSDYESTILPKWLYKYLVFRFNLLDRTGKTNMHIIFSHLSYCFNA